MKLSKNEVMGPDELLLIGKILKAHGVKGEVKVYPYLEEYSLMDPGREVLVEPPGKPAALYRIHKAQVYKNVLRVAFEAVGDRNAAEELAGGRVLIPRSMLPPAEPDAWYWCDLIGLDVYDANGELIGRVAAMMETGSNDVFVVRQDGDERLIPAIASVILDIDLEAGQMRVDLPEGL
ncbi:MAG: ribosome maturation factor RimM [Desulfobacteraceae bacterium]|nr:ribosome maturation factor RimM [Desulfobacteraceae bacterium]